MLINGAAHGGLSRCWALVYDPGHGAMGQGQTACPTGGWMGSWRGDRFNRRLIEVWLYSALAIKWNAPHRTECSTIVLNIWYIKDGMNRTSSVFYMHSIDIIVNSSPVHIFHKKNVWPECLILMMYARLLQSLCLYKPRPFLTIHCKLPFRFASIQSTTDG